MPNPTKPTQKPSYVKDLALLFGIPLAIAALAAAIVYLPSLSAKPSYDFIYTYCNDYGCNDAYSVDPQDHVIENEIRVSETYQPSTPTKLAYYDAATGGSRLLSYDEARDYTLINSSKSPEGYTLHHSSNSGGFLFWSDYSSSWQLENGLKKKTLHLNGDSEYYSNNITFLGWVRK